MKAEAYYVLSFTELKWFWLSLDLFVENFTLLTTPINVLGAAAFLGSVISKRMKIKVFKKESKLYVFTEYGQSEDTKFLLCFLVEFMIKFTISEVTLYRFKKYHFKNVKILPSFVLVLIFWYHNTKNRGVSLIIYLLRNILARFNVYNQLI